MDIDDRAQHQTETITQSTGCRVEHATSSAVKAINQAGSRTVNLPDSKQIARCGTFVIGVCALGQGDCLCPWEVCGHRDIQKAAGGLGGC